MSEAGGDDLLTATVILLGAGVTGLVLFRRLGFGSVLGLLIVGMLLGPYGLGFATGGTELEGVAEIGVVFLLFLIGLEMQPETLWGMRRAVFGLGGLQVTVSGVVMAGLAAAFGQPPAAAFILGFGLALSSTAMCVQMMEERGELYSDWGRRSFAILLFQDLAIVPLLALVPLLAGGGLVAEPGPFLLRLAMVSAALLLVYLAGRHLLPWALDIVARQRNMEAFTGLAVLAVVVAAWAMRLGGLSMALGAFLMGLLLSRSRYHYQLEAEVAPFKGLLLGLFFIDVGMTVDLGALLADLPRLLPLLLAMLVLKAAVVYLLARLFRLDRPGALRSALLLSQGGEFGFVLFGAAAARGILDPDTYGLAILLISSSMIVSPLLQRLGDRLAARLRPPQPLPALEQMVAEMEGHAVICGYGRVGGTVGMMLDGLEIPFVAIDQDPVRVEAGRRGGKRILYGNATDPKVLKLAGVGRAGLVLVTIDNPAVAERVVTAVRNFFPDIPIVARARDLEMRDRMLAAGVSEAVPEAVELAITLGAVALRHMGVAEADARDIADMLRRRAFAALRRHPSLARPSEATGRARALEEEAPGAG
ncbi:MAG TPA: portal protein [Rhodospirillales bacterium]|nr:portal protein [Rhodospirillales bacterium]